MRGPIHRRSTPAVATLLIVLGWLLVPTSAERWSSEVAPALADPTLLPLDEFSPAFLGMYRKLMDIDGEIRRHAERYRVDSNLARALCLYESGGDGSLVSAAGARGYFQVMPSTFRSLKVETNIEAGIKYLGEMLRRFEREDYAVAAYNAGPDRVNRSRPMPLETLQYVLGVGHYRVVLRMYEASVRHHASQLRIETVRDEDDWGILSKRLGIPLVELRLYNPFQANRPLRPGYRIAYPTSPRPNLLRAVAGAVEYRARHGDNYFNIAFSLEVELDRLRALNGLWHLQTLPHGMLLRIPLESEGPFTQHRVDRVQRVADLARTLGSDPWRLMRDNGLFWSEEVVPGTVLRVRRGAARPTDLIHQVRKGDTLAAIARRYATSVKAIQTANDMGARAVVRIGERLKIPSPPPTSAPPAAQPHE